MNKKQKKKPKVNGVAGWINFMLGALGTTINLVGIGIIAYIINKIIGGDNLIGTGITLLLVYNLIFTTYYILSNKYYIRRLNEEEYANLLKKRLINYTNYIASWDEHKDIIEIKGNASARSNYSMRWKDAKSPFVWFHQSGCTLNEPDIEGFFSSHLCEAPRKYKIIINPDNLERENIYIRPWDGSILYKGDYRGKACVETRFKWYSGKVMFRAIKDGMSLEYLGLMLFVSIKQGLGNLRDLI